MTRVRVTYHMSRRGEVAETCVELSMEPQHAADFLRDPPRFTVNMDRSAAFRLSSILHDVAFLQGYRFEGVATAEEVPLGA